MASEPFIDYKPSQAGLPPLPASPSQSSAEDEPLYPSKRKLKKERANALKAKSLLMVNASAALDGCDDQLLPATFRALERDLNFHPSLLGYITLAQTMCLSLLCPLWGYLSDRHSRKWLLAFGTFAWGLTTTLLGLVSEFWQVRKPDRSQSSYSIYEVLRASVDLLCVYLKLTYLSLRSLSFTRVGERA